jgi:bla regulator protein blaR1
VNIAKIAGIAAVMLANTIQLQAQPAFEVASIREHKGTYTRVGVFISGPRVTIEAYGLLGLIMDAYQLNESIQISGGPSWMSSDSVRFDITAIAPSEGKPTGENVRLMLQTLLADRFQLKVHRDTQERPVYALVVAKNGPKLKESAPDEQSSITASGNRTAQITMANVSTDQLAIQLSDGLDRPVVDKTGLKGHYDVKLNWIPEFAGPPPPGSDGVNLFTAVQEQLGLKLEPQKAAIEILVIDHVEKPSGN